ncbi:MAG: DUF305 domain-containing protein [Chloroflexota bacterium]|nr:DUF305 domain-containing protein [Chloroflexota bacterium]
MKRIIGLLTLVSLLIFVFAVAADAPINGRAGRAEVRSLQGMIDHHQMALMMANHCLERATTEEVQAICTAVIAAQTPEIEQMRAWLLDWYDIEYADMPMMGMGENMGGMGGMSGDMPNMMGMMAGLNDAEGIDYDIAWLEAMIDHHDDAIHMSQRILARAEHPELIELSQNIIRAQSAENEQMEALIVTLSS